MARAAPALLVVALVAGCRGVELGSHGARTEGRFEPWAASTSTHAGAAAAADACPPSPASLAFSQPIAAVEDLGLHRYPPLLGFPIAFARGAKLASLSGFAVTTPDGRALPTQVEVLSRWGDGPGTCAAPIRWAYAWVLGEMTPSARAFVSLRHPAAAPERAPAIAIEEDASRVVIDTGPARFTVRKDRFTGIASVAVRAGGAWTTVAEDAAFAVEKDGALASPRFGRALGFELERRGPNVATILARGTYATEDGGKVFRYTIRLHFYAGTAAVEVDHTYYHGDLADITAHGGSNRMLSDRVFLRVPLRLGAEPEITARTSSRVHRFPARAPVAVQQDKRTPERREVVSSIVHGQETLELGIFADRPLLAVASRASGLYAMATIAFMGPRDPQALRFDPARGTLDVDFQSEAMFVGGARGIWSKAVLDFGVTGGVDLAERGLQLYAHAARPLIGVPSTAYLAGTRALGTLPAGELGEDYARFDRHVDRIHARTAEYLRKYRITGVQIWPDLARTACRGADCDALQDGYFDGGDDNYWDWSLVELEEFLRTGDPSFAHDFALPEAITMAETISFRPDAFTKSVESSFGGFSPCYGGARGEDGLFREGLNQRIGVCPGDYSYNKVHRLAYLLTADRRFTDFFSDGAETAIRMYKDPPRTRPDKWLELSASRTTSQYLEPLLDAAELGRIGGDAQNRAYRDRAIAYFEHMKTRALERGHTCDLLGSGGDDPKARGECVSDQAWMLPPWIDWVSRLAELYGRDDARAWLLDFAAMSAQRHTVLDARGLPELSAANGLEGWRTVYRCAASARGVDDERCEKVKRVENEGYFYPNGLLAYLNAYGLVLESDPGDPRKICAWLPEAYARALRAIDPDTNAGVWGKELGQAYAFTQRTLGALERCPR